MENANSVATPLATQFTLSVLLSPSTDAERNYMSRVPHASANWSIMHAMVCTRPDLSHAVGVVSKYMANQGKKHWNAVKWILRYFKGTSGVGLVFGGDSDTNCIATQYVN